MQIDFQDTVNLGASTPFVGWGSPFVFAQPIAQPVAQRHAHRLPAAMSAHPAASRIAIVGAGPAGLALALLAAQRLPLAQITLFDARTAEHDVSGDPRTLALALGSVQMLQRLRAWPAAGVQPITAVCVSQAPPTWAWRGLPAELTLNAADEGVTMLGAVLRYGTLVACMQQAWLAAAAAAPGRLHTRFGAPVKAIKALTSDAGVEIDSAIAEEFDLAVVAEGGVFAEQSRKALATTTVKPPGSAGSA